MDKMIVYEDNVLLIIHKPAGIATQTSRIGQADMVSELKNYRKSKGENTYIGVIHRLDQPVEGLLVFAKNQSAAEILSRQLQDNTLKKKLSCTCVWRACRKYRRNAYRFFAKGQSYKSFKNRKRKYGRSKESSP